MINFDIFNQISVVVICPFAVVERAEAAVPTALDELTAAGSAKTAKTKPAAEKKK